MKTTYFSLIALLGLAVMPALNAGEPTAPYQDTKVEALLNIDVTSSTDRVNLVRGNSDPDVITKAYQIKNADPYTLRGYLLQVVNATSINTSPVQVDALKFNDGSALLLVSAEDYRFEDTANGEGIDSIIKRLDRKDLTFGGNNDSFIYFPRITAAADMMEMVSNVGVARIDQESAFGNDTLRVDGQLNALVVSAPKWSWSHIYDMLKKYDAPAPEVRISYQVWEVYTENDDKIGLDFQSWKNNDGVDLFSVGTRTRRNWSTLFTGNVTHNGNNSTSYYDFNPKWNTRYVDFLASNGHASLMASGTILAKNREESFMEINSGYFYDLTDGEADLENGVIVMDHTTPNVDVIQRQPITKILPYNTLNAIAPTLKVGDQGQISIGAAKGLTPRMQGALIGDVLYTAGSTTANVGGQTVTMPTTQYNAITSAATGNLAGVEQAYSEQAVIETLNKFYEKYNWSTTSATAGIIHGKLQFPQVQGGFKFRMNVTPVVTQKASTVDFNFEGISLIGWNSDGTPRISNSKSNTKVQLVHGAKEFVIDDIQKVEVVRSVNGVPLLKDLPGLGWLFANESESTKKTRLVIMLRAEYAQPNDKLTPQVIDNIGKIIDDVEKGWKSPINNMGFQQLLLDVDTWK